MSTRSIDKQYQRSPLLAADDSGVDTSKQSGHDGSADGRYLPQVTSATTVGAEGELRQKHDETGLVASEKLSTSVPAGQTPAPTEANPHAEPEEDDVAYEEPAPEEILAPAGFKSFFALIEDPETGEHYHPSVHYIFSDDDSELLTNSALGAIATGQAAGAGQQVDQEERIVVLDMASDGKEVAAATSLSPHWQALKTTVTQAPSWGSETTATNSGLMLKISGQEALNVWGTRDKGAFSGDPEELARIFNEKLQRLNDIMGNEEGEIVARSQTLGKSSNVQ